ncbi:FAD-dependent monooxygenase [Gryllotalpicola daejeonensis]|uniref:FAD-dependent monooxygenase n=1 Tax=Gryllotalpicola daejeonensis TaxID=993087 RepID=A0ABP7ZNI5_9MICO
MQFHHRGYVSGDPRVAPASGFGIDRPEQLPDELDVLIVGTGPAGMIAAAQLAQFPGVNTRIVEKRGGRLEVGQADGIQSRTVETFNAFGFASRIIDEAYRITQMAFWNADPENPQNIIRTSLPEDDPSGISEFPHLCVNQARVQDYFAEAAHNAPTRLTPDYGWEFVGLTVDRSPSAGEYPVEVRLRRTVGPDAGAERVVHTKYVVGCDGARSAVRAAIGRKLVGDQAMHAWGVMDVLAVTDFPDIRTKCAIQSHDGGSILLIPREGGHLFRLYVDLGEVHEGDNGAVRQTPLDEIIARANRIMHPYTVEVKSVAWHSVYEVGHRLTDKFDDVTGDAGPEVTPRVLIAGDACHTHSAKAGQGMNVSMQDGWNLSWKLGHVIEGRATPELLATYSAERQVIAKDLIEFDKQWSSLMASKPEDFPDPNYLAEFYVKTFEFPSGFMTQYQPSLITATAEHQELATGFPIGKRFKSAEVVRVSDGNPIHLGHQHRADGRWRIYVFADAAAPTKTGTPTAEIAEWLRSDPASPLAATPAGGDEDAWFDVKVVYQQDHSEIRIPDVPEVFTPRLAPFGLADWEKVYGAGTIVGRRIDIFDERGISRDGAVVVVRPDQYVSAVLPLSATDELAAFFAALAPRVAAGDLAGSVS